MNKLNLNRRILTIVSDEEVGAGSAPANEQNGAAVKEAANPNNNDEKKPSVDSDAETVENLLTPELLATALGLIKSGVKVKTRIIVSYLETKGEIKPVFIKGNRKIYPAQVNRLWKDIENRPVKKFTRPCVVICAKTVLENNPGIKLFDLYGKEVALGTPGIEKMYAVVDGQNRLFAVLAHPEADLDLELLDFDGDVLELIKIFNTNTKNWGINDFLDSNIEVGKVGSGLRAKMTEIQNVIKASDKVAAFLATFKKDAIKKSDVIKGEDHSGYDENKGERGLRLATALSYQFGYESPIKVEFVEAIIGVYDALKDMEKGLFTDTMVGCIAEMDNTTKTSIDESMKAKDFGKVGKTISETYKTYANLHGTGLSAHVKKLWTKVKKKVETSITTNPVKSKGGSDCNFTPSEIYQEQLKTRLFLLQSGRASNIQSKSDLEAELKTKEAKSTKTTQVRARIEKLKKEIGDLQTLIDLDDISISELNDQLDSFSKTA